MGYKVGEYVLYHTEYGGGYGEIKSTNESTSGAYLRYEVNRPGSTAWVHELQILASLTEDDVKLCIQYWGKKVSISSKDKKRPGRVIGISKNEGGLNFWVLYLDTLDAETKQYRHNEMTIIEE